MIDWWTAGIVTLLTIIIYVAFFWKINWVKGLNEDAYSRRCLGPKNRKVGKLPPVYPNGWFCLLESWQLKKGQVKHVAALGENFAVFRTENGDVKILNAYCPHLGANMGEGGTVKGDCLECPFHSWLFSGDNGQCQSIPYAKKVPESAKTKAWKCREVNRIIFVWYHAESAEPDWEPQPIEPISDGSWWDQGRNEYLINSHIQEIPENGADWAHFSAVHGPGIFFNDSRWGFVRHSWTNATWSTKASRIAPNVDDELSIDEVKNDELQKTNGSTVFVRSVNKRSENHRATGTLTHNVVLFERFFLLGLNVTAEQLGPGYVELTLDTRLGKMCILQTVTPIGPLLQRVTHTMFSPPLLAPYAKLVLLGECLMFERDIAVWNHKKFERRPVLVREDRNISAFRRWYEQFYTANSPTYESAMALEW